MILSKETRSLCNHYKMATTIIGDGILYTEYPVLAQSGTHFTRVVVDDGDIQIDKASHSNSGSHLFLKGALQSHEAFIKIENSGGTELLRVDHQGKIHAPVGIIAPEISALTSSVSSNNNSLALIIPTVTANTNTLSANQTTILNNTTASATNAVKLLEQDVIKTNLDNVIVTLNASGQATDLPVDGSLVKRKNTNEGTVFEIATINKVINVGKTVAQYGNANYQWIPQKLVNGTLHNDPKAIVRCGRNHEEIGHPSIGDGLEVRGLLPEDGFGERNNVLITANEYAPSLEMVCNKSAGSPWIRLRDHEKVSKLEISEEGVAHSLAEEKHLSITPNVQFSTTHLYTGVFRLNFTLSDKWDSTSSEMVIMLKRNDEEDVRFVTACEVFIDESQVQSNHIASVIYIDRFSKNVRTNGHSFLRIVLKLELLENETELPVGTKFALTVNNQTLLL